MKFREEVYNIYWHFAYKRQEIFFNRIKNQPYPWTDDYILSNYKFTNVYRASDRVSQYLIRNVIYSGENFSEEDMIFRILVFKIFNKIETWELLEQKLGVIQISTFNISLYSKILIEAMSNGQSIYTSAYMSCATKAFGYDRKHDNHLALIDLLVREEKAVDKIICAKSLEEIYYLLLSYPLIGKFLAYQLAIDFNYTDILNFSENDFVIAGPGAVRGIKKCFDDVKGKDYSQIIYWMVDNQEGEFQRLGLNFQSLWGRKLHAIDCQNLFCEVDKYSRVAFPNIKSNRKRIKHKFHANKNGINYFYPPKWRINDFVKEFLTKYKEKTNTVEESSQLSLGI